MLANPRPQAAPADPIAALIEAGDYREAVRRCADVHGRSLGRLCLALLGSQTDAEEVVQETLLAAHRAMPSFRGEGTVRAWLFGIARRQCARQLERDRRHRGHLSIVAEPAHEIDPEVSLHALQRARSVRAALSTLRPSEREALLLRFHAELSFREIAELCGIDEAAARKRASRGLDRLRKTLSSQERQ
jgi:RNA polymerase sigma-70 factor (ECF subfamily)